MIRGTHRPRQKRNVSLSLHVRRIVDLDTAHDTVHITQNPDRHYAVWYP